MTRPPRLLIVSGNLALLRGHYRGVITELVKAGVEVRIRYFKDGIAPSAFAELFAEAGVQVDVQVEKKQLRRPQDRFALRLRELGNVFRFVHPDYAGRTALADRALQKATPGVRRWALRLQRLGPRAVSLIVSPIRRLESVLPPSVSATELVREQCPDAVVVIPVVRNPGLVDYLKAARLANVASVIWVQSWDNLTNKGLLHFRPDRVFVWNASQEEELSRYNDVPKENVCITGAQTFDHWFEGESPASRPAFCADLGVDEGRPILLYLASSKQIAPREPEFFSRWLAAIRASPDPILRDATVLIRPHPTLAAQWHARKFDQEPSVVVSPSTLRTEINSDAFREQYRNELHHASVVIGVNTSGFIDAAIFGKPGCTVELPELFQGQRGTVHFQHLIRPGAALLRSATSLDEHVVSLAELVGRDPYAIDEQSAEFVRAFVRPHGMDVRPGDVFVREMLELLHGRGRRVWPGRVSPAVGRIAGSVAFLPGAPLEERPTESLLEHGEALVRYGARKLRRDPRAADALVRRTKRKPLRPRFVRGSRKIAGRVAPAWLRRLIRSALPKTPDR